MLCMHFKIKCIFIQHPNKIKDVQRLLNKHAKNAN